jgi:ATP-binding cassette subfamily B protein
LVTRAGRFIKTFNDLFDSSLFVLLTLVVQIVGSVIILAGRSALLSLLFVCAALLLGGVTIFLSRFKTVHLRRAAEADSRVTGALADALTNMLAIKVFARDEHETKLFHAVTDDRRQLLNKQMSVGEMIRAWRTLVIVLFHVTTAFLLIRLTERGQISIGTILLVQLYLSNLVQNLWNINRIVERLEEALADAAEMTEVILRKPRVQDVPGAAPLRVRDGAIAFDNMAFRYQDAEDGELLFEDLDLQIAPGQKVGLVGPSGGGKTTLTKLLLRFTDIDAGQITVDGQDIANVRQDDLRRAIAYVPQEPLLFHRSIRENIAYGDPTAGDKDIERAAKLAHADGFIRKLPQGYNTLVGERGVKLSGGEKQRVAIARAMLKKAPIVVLDEATSALDSKSEKAIVSALDNLMQNRTTIVIAHRLSTIRKLDRIVVLKDGKIAEDGPHATLLKQKGIYAELWQHQSGEFLPEE